MDEKLTVSGQLHGEVGMMSLGKIYTFSPCFRAEKSTTKKHLSEFWMIEVEHLADDLGELILFAEQSVKRFIAGVITIFPVVGELIGGSLREHDYDKLKESMITAGLDMKRMEWYLDTRRWGSVPHGGWGLGFERLLMFITQASKIHDVIPFPISF